jgi:hypothetical protein
MPTSIDKLTRRLLAAGLGRLHQTLACARAASSSIGRLCARGATPKVATFGPEGTATFSTREIVGQNLALEEGVVTSTCGVADDLEGAR